ncbi:hypothetical protein MMPV_004834 [Pyropia vietnamensis]
MATASPVGSPKQIPSAYQSGILPPMPLRRTTIDYTPFVVSARYTNLGLIARGSGTVLVSATDVGRVAGAGTFPRQVAIKKVPDVGASVTTTRQLLREIRILRSVSHPHLLRLLDLTASPSDGGVGKRADVYLVTPLATGGDLGAALAGAAAGWRPPLADTTLRRVMYQTLSALAALHDAGIVHRDVKPENIFLTGGGPDGVGDVLLGDFGLSRYIPARRPRGTRDCSRGALSSSTWRVTRPAASMSGSATMTSADDAGLTQGVATRGYRPPELTTRRRRRCRPAYDASMDLWAVGVVLAQALVPGARIPTRASSLGWAGGAGSKPWDVPAWIAAAVRTAGVQAPPTDAVDLLRRLLAVDPVARISAAEAMAHPYVVGSAATALAGSGVGILGRGGGGGVGGGPARGRATGGVRLEPPAGAGKAELGALLWSEVTAFHPELENERPLLGTVAGEKKRRRGLVALLRRR